MKRNIATAALAAIALLAFTPDSQAKDKDDKRGPDKGSKGSSFFKKGGPDRHDDRHDHDHDHDRGRDDDDRRRFFAHPRSKFVVTLGNGYAGRGYYYGPPNANYYYQGSGVVYYSSRERVPRQYWGSSYSSTEMSVQRELAKRGYYNGPIDGSIGPGSRASIARYQRDRRLPVTGSIDSYLLRSLGL
ncbi:putative peptidoglycan binding protein [Prosthecobacter fusiformis]|uniref:Putative peptidoglycan binding protein n=1 Tax=Prosthecobacter fusiformis TaxID=48464 RepID=A0A4R7SQM8_9BACT|nr:peptidoglycan-binding protein [Prosthecobacter fusiformis]TDU81224.1 putative peptidoglycan binding protein [Prosthecobacter fusiformis]